jgi:hypothetical protein
MEGQEFYVLSTQKFGVELWSAKRFIFLSVIQSVKNLSVLQSSTPKFGVPKGFFPFSAPKIEKPFEAPKFHTEL